MPLALTIRDQVAANLRGRILRGDFPPGTPLLEAPLARELGVSRGPIRDALLTLNKEGLLTAKPNVGARVAQNPSPFKRAVIVQMRRALEAAALAQWFVQGEEGLLVQLDANLIAYQEACSRELLEPVVELDMAFHRLIVGSADQGSLLSLWEPLILQIFLRYSRHHSLIESHAEHAAILHAMRDGASEVAVAALISHIV